MTIDETVIENRCIVCAKSRPPLAARADDPFCSSRCAKTYHGTVMESSGFSGARQQGDKKNAYASVENPYVPTTRLAQERWQRSEALKEMQATEKAAIARLARALNARETVAA
jgi:hypothetical protein